MSKLKQNQIKILKIISLLLFVAILSSWKLIDSKSSITDFYYYKDKPLNIKIRTDKIFIKSKDVLTKEELKSTLSKYTQIAPVNKFDANEKMQFIDLAIPVSDAEIVTLTNMLNQNPNIEYTSPVFSPFDGSRDKVLQGLIDEILVQFKPGVSENRINEYIKENGFTIVQTLSLTGGASYVLKVPLKSGTYSMDFANKVYNSGLVNWSEPNFYYSGLLSYAPNDQFFPRQWSIRNLGNNIPEGISGTAGCDMRVDSAWNITLGIPQCIVAMVDSGIDTTHEDIRANLLISRGYDYINGHPLQTDEACVALRRRRVGKVSDGQSRKDR